MLDTGWLVRCYRWVLGASPRAFRDRYLDDATDALVMMVADTRQRRGRLAAGRLWMSALADAIRTTRHERQDAGDSWFRGWFNDVRLAGRAIRRSPGYAFVVITTLTLAVGGVTAVFTLADPMLFRPLPYPDADRIKRVVVRGEGTFGGFGSYFDYARLKNAASVESLGGFEAPVIGRLHDDLSEPTLLGYSIYDGYLSVLGLTPAVGRPFTAVEYADAPARTSGPPPAERPALLSDVLSRRIFGRPDAALGKTVALRWNGQEQRLNVVGVLGPDFVFPDIANQAPAFLVPGRLDMSQAANPRMVADLMVRLRPDVSLERAATEIGAILAGVERDNPTVPKGRTATLMGLRQLVFSRVRPPLLMLLWATGLVLVLAAGNLAHLSLARAQDRAREVAVRRSLGASRWRIVRLLATESAVLSAIGAAGALAFGQMLFSIVMAVVPRFGHVYRLMPAGLDARVILFGLLATAGAVLTFGLVPALIAARRDGRVATPTLSSRLRRGRRIGDEFLAVIQSALAVGVLVTATLIVGSFVKLVNTIQGIDMDGLVSVGIELPAQAYSTLAARHQFTSSFVAGVESRTGQRLAISRGLPGVTLPSPVRRATDPANSEATVIAYPADRTFLDTVRVELVRGRLYDLTESNSNAPVAVLDERAASFLWPDGSALGRTVADYQSATPVERQVVGVVRNVDVDFRSDPGHGRAFVPLDPAGRSSDGFLWRGPMTESFRQTLRDAATAVEPRALVGMSPLVPFERSLGEPRLLARLLGALGLIALLLSVSGVYAIVSHAIAARTGEIGVRMALGATPQRIRTMVLRQSLRPTIIGILIGFGLCWMWTKSLASLLFGLTPGSPVVFASAGVMVLAAAAVASAMPARRASRIDPAIALRTD